MKTLYYVVRKRIDDFDVIIPITNLTRNEYTENINEAMYTLEHMQRAFQDCVYELKSIEG